MGCINSKRVTETSPLPVSDSNARRNGGSAVAIQFSSLFRNQGGLGELEKIKEEPDKENGEKSRSVSRKNSRRQLMKWGSKKNGNLEKKVAFSLRFGRYTEAEHIAAGWPPWLSAVAGDAVEGWIPLRADLFEKLDKVGQGTYSSVYRARDVQNGRIVALKKVRFDNFQEESVRFMAREIAILRRLDHPHIVKLEGLITNRLSCSIYLVFEYMEHDLAGLLSCPEIKFSDIQIKCYMQQLLDGLEHCHSRGIMHRDIKTSNILVNNEGILKIADLGLANYINPMHRQALTSRVVTLWYRPPELLLGSTTYGASVDLWSVGCVFAELFNGKPILKGRTEVEQLHKIFKLCGSPPDEYWKRSKLPLATIFKPQHPYVSTLRERCRELPKSAVHLLETLISIEPHKRGTASTALDSEYFTTRPYACDPSSLPKYPPNKEFDAKIRDEARRRKAGFKARASGTSRNATRPPKAMQEPTSKYEMDSETQFVHRNNGGHTHIFKAKGTTVSRESMNSSYDTVSEASQTTDISQADSFLSVPVITSSSGFAWAKQRRSNYAVPTRFYSQVIPKGQHMCNLEQENKEFLGEALINSGGDESYDVVKHALWRQSTRADSLDASHVYDSPDASHVYDSPEFSVNYNRKKGRVQLSGPLLPQPNGLDEDQENYYLHKPARRSRFYRD